jgi:hypothetical protein
MYKQIETDKSYLFMNKALIPMATLQDETGSKVQITLVNDCFFLHLTDEAGKYYSTCGIFKEVLEVLKTLSIPDIGVT